jgi:hypothetical protein
MTVFKKLNQTIIYKGRKLDPQKQHEIFAKNKNGFHVKVWYNGRNQYENKSDVFNNITEVHWLYKSIQGKRVAFETNIHQTGFTYSVTLIKKVKIRRMWFKRKNV